MIKFLHLADFHINAPFLKEEEMVRKGLKSKMMKAFASMVDLAIDEEVDAFIIAGDLFDAPPKSTKIIAMVMTWFRQLTDQGIKVFYIAGNHDFNKVMEVPEGVYYAYDGKTKIIQTTTRNGMDYRVVMTGHEAKHVKDNRLAYWPPKEDDLLTIGIGHCAVAGVYANEREQGYMPVAIRELEGKHYDYIALGHIHLYQEVGQTGRIFYAGNGMGLDRTELGDKGGLLVTLDEEKAHVKQVVSHGIKRRQLKVDVSGYERVEALIARLKEEKFSGDDYVYLVLHGQTSIYDEIVTSLAHRSWETFIASQLGVFHVRVNADDVLPNIDLDRLKEENTVVGIGLNLLATDELMTRFMKMPTLIDRYPNESIRRQYIESIKSELPIEWVKAFISNNRMED